MATYMLKLSSLLLARVIYSPYSKILFYIEMYNRHVIIPNKMKRENMPETTYRHNTMMVWSVAKYGESNSLV